jgi:hypothetical protein
MGPKKTKKNDKTSIGAEDTRFARRLVLVTISRSPDVICAN